MAKRRVCGIPPARSAITGLALALSLASGEVRAAQVVVDGPPGTESFGTAVTVLPNGNFVVTDPRFDAPGPVADVGAVFLYKPDGGLISTLTGSNDGDQVGSGGVAVLGNGNFVVGSPRWTHGAAVGSGAVTFGSGSTGISGTVSPANSLVGSTAGDSLGRPGGLVALPNGNYVVVSPGWDRGAAVDAGAVTFGSGAVGINGPVSANNSLVGGSAGDRVGDDGFGDDGIVVLVNGNYVVRSPDWDNGAAIDAGAATFCLGTTGVSGAVSATNSLVGTSTNDKVGYGVDALANGNYVVGSPFWDRGATPNAGAATFGSGTTGVRGIVSLANSLVGSGAEDLIGGHVIPLSNGNYVAPSFYWDHGSAVDAGAAIFGSGVDGVIGVVSPTNALVGTTAGDRVGIMVTALSNGNYVVSSPDWDNAATIDAGAVTFGSGTAGIVGAVAPANSLFGATANDSVGRGGATPLRNGNYVAGSSHWSNGPMIKAGAVTFGSGTVGISGAVSPSNSLVGGSQDDQVGSGIVALHNGNYVVSSTEWDNGDVDKAGAATFGSGTTGISGVVSPANSLVGSSAFDRVGASITPLANGSYVVRSPDWDNQGRFEAGAATFGSGTTGVAGVVSSANSLVGSNAGDSVGKGVSGVIALSNGAYVVGTSRWDSGTVVDAGAATYGSGSSGISGVISPANSIVGSRTGDFQFFFFTAVGSGNFLLTTEGWDNGPVADAGAITLGLAGGSVVGPLTTEHSVLGLVSPNGSTRGAYDAVRNQLIVGQYASNRVVIHRTGAATETRVAGSVPDPSPVGQPVRFTATVTASPVGPGDGVVTFRASSGETCTDSTATETSGTAAAFSCDIAFTTPGVSTVVAEYTGSLIHAFSRSSESTHFTVEGIFFDGFEAP